MLTKLTIKILKPSFQYHSLLGRPVDGLGPNALINMNIDLITLMSHHLPETSSMIVMGVAQYLVGAGIYHISEKYFQRNLQGKKQDFLQISSSSLLSSALTVSQPYTYNESYYWLGLFRALQPQTYDHTFMLPIIAMTLNWLMLRYSNVKLLSAIQGAPHALINLSFMAGLATIGLPWNYMVVGLCMQGTHLTLRTLINAYQAYKIKKFQSSLRLTRREIDTLLRK